ncbi:OLC1v1024945C1 [Oldenlandia corymbosa var. corymbosa]|uniref:OLC1v1024945C1 n=1 Tax=Oldenlandia corymbosa var. corymbosa TaxID=529605 RepID=A0AAV1C6D3_OLDCO|nr:OLC1v1024945C1 [Oldenlandia corymbosa var. corymbosa]
MADSKGRNIQPESHFPSQHKLRKAAADKFCPFSGIIVSKNLRPTPSSKLYLWLLQKLRSRLMATIKVVSGKSMQGKSSWNMMKAGL